MNKSKMVAVVTRTVFIDGTIEESTQTVRESGALSSVAWAGREYAKAGYENVSVSDTCVSATDTEDGSIVSTFIR